MDSGFVILGINTNHVLRELIIYFKKQFQLPCHYPTIITTLNPLQPFHQT